MESTEQQATTNQAPEKAAETPSNRKQFFYAIISSEEMYAGGIPFEIVDGNSRTEIKKKLLERGREFTVHAIFRGRQVKFQAKTQVNFC